MAKDTYLINIYLKIHNKRPLTMKDLKYLAKYDPECFEKTCQNVVYNSPETKPIMQPAIEEQKNELAVPQNTEGFHYQNIDMVLENLKRLEMKELPIADVDAEKVKNLLGNLYMELLFPHNGKETYIPMFYEDSKSKFDKKA